MTRRAFTGPDADGRYERAGHFLLASILGSAKSIDWCNKRGVRLVKAASEGIGTGGAFLVPTELERAILDIRDAYGSFRRRALVYPMGSDSAVFPRRTAVATAAFISENATAGTASLSLDAVNLTAKKLGALLQLSHELDEDSIFDMVDYVADEIALALASKEDDCGFFGDGTSTYGGMRGCTVIANDGGHTKAKVTAASGHNTYALLDTTDLGNLMGAVRASALPRAAWFASSVAVGQTFGRLAGQSGALQMGIVDGMPTPIYNGFPVIETQKFSLSSSSITGQAMMAFGDMRAAAVLGQRRGLTVKRSDERYLDTDQVGILVTERFDAIVHDMGDTSTFGSLAVLFAP